MRPATNSITGIATSSRTRRLRADGQSGVTTLPSCAFHGGWLGERLRAPLDRSFQRCRGGVVALSVGGHCFGRLVGGLRVCGHAGRDHQPALADQEDARRDEEQRPDGPFGGDRCGGAAEPDEDCGHARDAATADQIATNSAAITGPTTMPLDRKSVV